MKGELTEKQVFYRIAQEDLLTAHDELRAIKSYKRNIAVSALIKSAITSYMRPFTSCRGKFGTYKIPDGIIPKKHKKLHDKIIRFWRDKIIAHSDIDIRNPSKWKVSFSSNKIDDRQYLFYSQFAPEQLLPELDEFKELIIAVLTELKKESEKIKQAF